MKRLVLILALLWIIPVSYAQLNESIVSYWNFDLQEENNNVSDVVNGNHGTNLSTQWIANGKLEGAYQFNLTANNSMIYLNNSHKTNDSNLTLSIWFRAPRNSSERMLYYEDSPEGGSWYLSYQNEIINFYIRKSAGVWELLQYNSSTDCHIFCNAVFMWDKDNMSIWVNGVDVASKNGLDQFYYDSWAGYEAGIGNYFTLTYEFLGIIDEVGYWNRTLTRTEIEQLYFGGVGLTYPFNNTLVSLFFYDEDTLLLLDNITISADLYSEEAGFSDEYSTGSGIINPGILYPGEYRITYSSTGYSQRTSYFDIPVEATSELNFSFYLSNVSQQVLATVYDSTADTVENVTIQYLRFDPSTGNFISSGEVITNFEGQAELQLVLNTELYKFILIYNDEVLFDTIETFIYSDTIEFQIDIGGVIGEDYFERGEIWYSLSFNNETNNFTYTFLNNVTSTGTSCLELWKSTPLEQTFMESSCIIGTSGSIVLGVDNPINGTTYYVNALVDNGLGQKLLDIAEYTYDTISQIGGTEGLYYQFVLSSALALAFIWNPPLMYLSVPISLFFGKIAYLHDISYPIIFGLFCMVILSLYLMHKWKVSNI